MDVSVLVTYYLGRVDDYTYTAASIIDGGGYFANHLNAVCS